jgi:hypothetical protein
MSQTIKTFTKRIGENLDYDFDFTQFLGTTDSITASTVTATPAGLTLGTKQNLDGVVKQWISSGAQDQSYSVICQITTLLGRIKRVEMILSVSGS